MDTMPVPVNGPCPARMDVAVARQEWLDDTSNTGVEADDAGCGHRATD
jgi:hypothetical protein